MDTNVDDLHLIYSGMDTEELIDRTKSGMLTKEAYVLALKELQSRGINTAVLPENPSSSPSEKEMSMGFFWRCWHGKEKLWKAFWLLGLLAAGFVLGLTRIASSVHIPAVLFLFVTLPIEVFRWVSVWRCAFRTSHWGWAILARVVVIFLVVLWCLLILRSLA